MLHCQPFTSKVQQGDFFMTKDLERLNASHEALHFSKHLIKYNRNLL
jgi:hypothetical protein